MNVTVIEGNIKSKCAIDEPEKDLFRSAVHAFRRDLGTVRVSPRPGTGE